MKIRYKINNGTEVLLVGNSYDESGQLIDKYLHSVNDDDFLQRIDYKYNIKGWLTEIDNPLSFSENDKFGLRLYYNSNPGGNYATDYLYNGNIAAMFWGTSNTSGMYYKFQYDNKNRLTSAEFYKSGWYANALNTDYEYDDNGNMTSIDRRGYTGSYIDQISATYWGSQPMSLFDASGDIGGTVDYPGNTYSVPLDYDENGNLETETHKLVDIDYNLLNLPKELCFLGQNKYINYFYTFNGGKLRQTVEDNGTITKTDYCGPFVYETVSGTRSLKYIVTPEGRAVKDGANWDFEYNLKDHLGNVRAVINDNGSGVAALIQQKHYYPFGMEISDIISGSCDNLYLYNGKEHQNDFDLDWYDYGARFYDPALARFHTQDRFAEKYLDFSPYQYAANNPIANIDINGDSIWFTQTDNAYTMHVSGKLINMSDNNVNMGKALKGIISQLQSTFSGEVDGMTFNTEVDLSVAETMDDVSESDHLFVLSEITIDKIGGAANDFGGKVAFLDADYFTGPFDATIGNVGEKLAAHEFGHLLNLRHFDGNTNIMRTKEQSRWYSFATSTTSRQLNQIMGSYNAGALNQGSPFGIMGLPNTGKVSSIIGLRQVEQKRRKIFNFPGIN